MASPFLAKFAAVFGEPAALDDAVKQVLLAETHLRDAEDRPPLSRLGRVEEGALGEPDDRAVVAVLGARRSAGTRWRSPTCSPRCRATIRSARAVAGACCGGWRARSRTFKTRRAASGGRCWTRADGRATSRRHRHRRCSSTRWRRADNNGWLDAKKFGPVAARGYAGMVKEFVVTDDAGDVHVTGICKVAGLGGNPYRDGSYDYYVGTEVVRGRSQGGRRVHPRQRGAGKGRDRRSGVALLAAGAVLRCATRARRRPAAAQGRAGAVRRAQLRRRRRRKDEGDGRGEEGDRRGGGGGRRHDRVLGRDVPDRADPPQEQHHAVRRRGHGAEVLERLRRLPADGPLALGRDRGGELLAADLRRQGRERRDHRAAASSTATASRGGRCTAS